MTGMLKTGSLAVKPDIPCRDRVPSQFLHVEISHHAPYITIVSQRGLKFGQSIQT